MYTPDLIKAWAEVVMSVGFLFLGLAFLSVPVLTYRLKVTER